MLNTELKLRVVEIFQSINGEITSAHQGSVCTFVRLAGCNCRCIHCDTKRSQGMDTGVELTIAEIMAYVEKFGQRRVTITGGEPLLQKNVWALIRALWEKEYHITVETNGSIDIIEAAAEAEERDRNTEDEEDIGDFAFFVDSWVIDYKLPSSGMQEKMNPQAFWRLSEGDFVKFVIGSKEDLAFALQTAAEIVKINDQGDSCQPNFAFSPCIGEGNQFIVSPAEIFDVVSKSGLKNVFINIQIHKFFNFQ